MEHRYDGGGSRSRDEEKPDQGEDRPREQEKERNQERDDSKGAGRKHGVQRRPEDQRGRPDPKVME